MFWERLYICKILNNYYSVNIFVKTFHFFNFINKKDLFFFEYGIIIVSHRILMLY